MIKMSASKGQVYVENIDGVNKPIFFSEKLFRTALDFKPDPGDIIICTYPKCGTTWMQNLVLNILRRGKPLEKPRDFFLASPFLEQLGTEDSVKMMIRPGAYKTHLPLNKLNWSSEAKYIYVARNPKDCCLSLYSHMRQLPGYQFDKPLDDFVDMFVRGEVEYNNYLDHLIPWYNNRYKPNLLFITFEDMVADLRAVTMKVIEFLGGEQLTYFSENPNVLDDILYNCSFSVMKSLINKALSSMYDENCKDLLSDNAIPEGRKHIITYKLSLPKQDSGTINFIRQGKAGKWKSELSEAQNKKLDEMICEKTRTNGVMSLWEG